MAYTDIRSRNIIFFLKKFTQKDIETCKHFALQDNVTFICIAKDNETLRVHMHFKNPARFNAISKMFTSIKYKKSFVNVRDNYQWCIKNCKPDKIWTQGVLPENAMQTTSKKVENDIKKVGRGLFTASIEAAVAKKKSKDEDRRFSVLLCSSLRSFAANSSAAR